MTARATSTAERRGLALALVVARGPRRALDAAPRRSVAPRRRRRRHHHDDGVEHHHGRAHDDDGGGRVDPAAVVPTDRFATAPGSSPVAGSGALRRYVVEIEEGIPLDAGRAGGRDRRHAGRSPRWTAAGDVALQRVDESGAPDLRIRLATPATVDAHCAPLETLGQYSCRQGDEVMINLARWMEGAAPSGLSLSDYRHYVISHEVGHALGHGHVDCPAVGARAPVMVQQTISLEGCTPNPWPYP